MKSMAAIRVEVVYALAGREEVAMVSLPAGATALDALAASGLMRRHPEIDFASLRLGVLGKRVPADARVADGDRVEVYRPLVNDPKESRRRRARARR
jgi:hypothetical protein